MGKIVSPVLLRLHFRCLFMVARTYKLLPTFRISRGYISFWYQAELTAVTTVRKWELQLGQICKNHVHQLVSFLSSQSFLRAENVSVKICSEFASHNNYVSYIEVFTI